ncbi:hypothetical protein [Smaragdicoccus niigatensis]|uniref:hypothetical protein n=1 Tax=Smaragdicoccus niigatensis TaxID=359359 RepID=UPI000369CB0B|nr:hypothetical protein [Smaragdicoccus niigatensis]
MDNEPENTQEIPAAEPAKPSFRQRAHDFRQRAQGRWSTTSDRTRLIAIIATGLFIFVVGFGSGLAVDGGRGHGYGHRGGGWCDNERTYRHHHQRWDCPPNTTAPTTTAPATTTPTTTTTAPTTTPAPAPAP